MAPLKTDGGRRGSEIVGHWLHNSNWVADHFGRQLAWLTTCGLWKERCVKQYWGDSFYDVALLCDRYALIDAHEASIELESDDVGSASQGDRAMGSKNVGADQEQDCELIYDEESVCHLDVGNGDNCDDVAEHMTGWAEDANNVWNAACKWLDIREHRKRSQRRRRNERQRRFESVRVPLISAPLTLLITCSCCASASEGRTAPKTYVRRSDWRARSC